MSSDRRVARMPASGPSLASSVYRKHCQRSDGAAEMSSIDSKYQARIRLPLPTHTSFITIGKKAGFLCWGLVEDGQA